METSCYGCTERRLGCHATCEKYKAFTDKLHQISKAKYDLSRRKVATITMQKCINNKIKREKKQ